MSESGSAFKKLYTAMITSGGDLSKSQLDFKDKNSQVKKIKCFVKESFPHFLVTDNHFYVPCYFTKKAVEDFRSKHSGVNIVDLKSKVVEIGDWTLEMAKVDSSTCFTSYGNIEIRLIANNFKLVQGTKDKVLLSRYPVNLYRDDEMKTLFQAYHHKCLGGAVGGSVKKDSLPDITKKGDSVVSFGSGRFSYPFKSGSTATVSNVDIFKTEKGAGALKKLQDGSSSGGGAVKVRSAVKTAKPKASAKKSAVKDASKIISKIGANPKKSVAKVGKTTVPRMKTPGDKQSSAQTPKVDMKNFKQMKKFLEAQRKK